VSTDKWTHHLYIHLVDLVIDCPGKAVGGDALAEVLAKLREGSDLSSRALSRTTTYDPAMAKQSPHTRWKGCRTCKVHKFKDAGQSMRKPRAELRRLGKVRRVSRHDLGDATS
jgi:hypothetical protein